MKKKENVVIQNIQFSKNNNTRGYIDNITFYILHQRIAACEQDIYIYIDITEQKFRFNIFFNYIINLEE